MWSIQVSLPGLRQGEWIWRAKGRCSAHTVNSEMTEQEFESGISDPFPHNAISCRSSVIAHGMVEKG